MAAEVSPPDDRPNIDTPAADLAADGTGDRGPTDVAGDSSGDSAGDRGSAGDVVAEGPPAGAPAGGFVVTATLERDGNATAGVPSPQVPARDVFTIHIADRKMVASRDGSVTITAIEPAGASWRATATITFGTVAFIGDCQRVRVSYEELVLTADGAGLRGTVRGAVSGLVDGDVERRAPFRGTFTAIPDRDPPRFVPDYNGRPHPLDFAIAVSVSEALPVGTTARLEGNDGSRVALSVADPAEPPARFVVQGPLAQGVTYRMVVEPRVVDLAGNAAAAGDLPGVSTLAIPLVPEDGFEGTTAPFLQAPAAIVGADAHAPITGQRSLFIPRQPGWGTTFRVSARLKVNPGDRFVRATVRLITGPSGIMPLTASFPMSLIGPGGIRASVGQIEVKPPLAPMASPFGSTVWGAAQTVELALPAGIGDEVLVDIHRPAFCGLGSPPDGALIDDLRVE
jgi:hypothetical protein